MKQKTKDKLEELKDTLFIVEGIKDKKALENLGIKKIITLKKPLYAVIEEIKEKEIVLLTDLDSKGKQLYKRIKSQLIQRGTKINDQLRQLLFKTKLSHIEGIDHYLL